MLNKEKFLMATPSVTREYSLGSHRNSRKTMRLPPRREMRPDSPDSVQSNSLFPIKQVRSFDLHDGTPAIPEEYPNKSRSTLMLPQEYEKISVAEINSR